MHQRKLLKHIFVCVHLLTFIFPHFFSDLKNVAGGSNPARGCVQITLFFFLSFRIYIVNVTRVQEESMSLLLLPRILQYFLSAFLIIYNLQYLLSAYPNVNYSMLMYDTEHIV